MFKVYRKELMWGGRRLVREPGKIARQADGAVLATYGGSSRQDQVTQLEKGIDIIVATPLRLVDLIKGKEVDLSKIEVVAIDEADRMADDGFTPQVECLLHRAIGEREQHRLFARLQAVGHPGRADENVFGAK